MLIIAFIHAFILLPVAGARPARTTDGSLLTLANYRWANDTLSSSPRHAMLLNASSMAVTLSIRSKSQYPTVTTQEQFSETSAADSTGNDTPLFNASFPQEELRAVTVKYSSAGRHLKGAGLSPMPNLTFLSDLLGTNDPSTQVSGSTFVLDLRTYGNDEAYYGQFSLGTPPQAVLLDVDTGSADLWVPGDCSTCDPRKAQFRPTASSTYSDTGQPFALTYGTGEVEGTLAQETVALGPMSVRQQYFGSISKESDEFSDVPFIGIIGMAFSSISISHKPTLMEQLIQERQVNAGVFSVYLTHHQPRQSEVCIGCYDPSKYIGTIFWNPVISQTYWSISLNNIQVGGVNTSPRMVTAAIDTGTSLIYLPQDLADAIYNQIPSAGRAPEYGAGLYSYPCDYRPIVSLVFGKQSHAISLEDFNLGKTSISGKDCIGGILATGKDLSPDLAIIGDEFLKSWYSIYDYGQGSRVGFAKSINNH